MAYEYSEDELVEKTAINIFYEQLGWDIAYAFDKETYGENGSLGRYSNHELILKPKLLAALKKYNPNLPEEAYQNAIEIVLEESSYLSLVDVNREKYALFKNGIKVSYKNKAGELVKDEPLKVFDFDNPENNNFLAVRQLWIQGRTYLRRPDIIGFVNGIPLLFIELKAVHKNLRSAYEGNLSDYKDTITKLFNYNAFIILSNGIKTKVGSITSRYEHFHEWKRITEEEKGIVSLDTTLKGMCDKKRFMDLLENFILFDDSLGKTIKLIARNHQYLGVNNAIESVRDIQENEGRLGVFWHTQGSGKSYSMAFFTEKIHRTLDGTYTFLVVTDREELDKQIYGTFAGVGIVNDDRLRASSGKNLKSLLKENHRYVFTLIHKFIDDELITERKDIIVISDEAHRTQQGLLALNMRKAIPYASFIGFTGTPLIHGEDELTKDIFGDYVSIYDFKRSVDDNSTVPLYYENRGEYLKLDNPAINEEMRRVIQESDLDPDQEEKLKRLFYRDYPILTAEKRLSSIAKDIVWHFNNRGYKGKGMVVSLDKVTAVRMYNYISKYWKEYITGLTAKQKTLTDEQEQIELVKGIQWAEETEIAVVVSSEQNEIDKFRKWGLDIEPHRQKIISRDLERDFKDEDHPFRLVIVCAMWITGFDVPSLSTMYLDKPLKGHTLMQTIARANRVYKEKNNGLIVDYIETYKNLLDALAIYGPTEEGKDDDDVKKPLDPKEKLITELEEVLAQIDEYFQELDCKLSNIIESEGLDKISALEKVVNAVCTNDETRTKFSILAKRMFVKYRAIMPDTRLYSYKPQKDAIQTIFDTIEEDVQSADVIEIMKKLQNVVENSVLTVLEPTLDYGKVFDISNIDFEKLIKKFELNQSKKKAVQQLKNIVERKLRQMMEQNPFRADYQHKYDEIITQYNLGKDEITIQNTFEELLRFVQTLGDEQKRVIKEGLDEEQMAIFDILCKENLTTTDRKKVKEVAVELLMKLKNDKLKIENWREKAQISAQIRTDILNKLYSDMPHPTYQNNDIDTLTNSVYWYVWNRYV